MGPDDSTPASPEQARVLALLKRYGWNATSFQVLEPGFRYWFDGEDACVAYVDTGHAWVAAGAPIAAPEQLRAVAEHFIEAARAEGRRACFFATERRFSPDEPFTSLHIGEQPVWEPTRWEEALRASKSLREQLRRARAKGVVVRELPASALASPESPERQAMERLVSDWLRARALAPMGFLVAVHLFGHLAERRFFVAEREGRVVALLAVVPIYARAGWFLEDLLRAKEAPNGTAELLVDAALRAAAAEGRQYVTLGLAPLAGEVSGWLRAARRWSRAFYDFEGLHAFKAKLRPQRWDPIYLTHPSGTGSTRAVMDALSAFASKGLLRFGLETLLRGPAIVVQVLAWLLVPWTLMLALATPRWFPSRLVQHGWAAFDVALAGALLWLGHRWNRALATVLAAVVTADAALTIAEAILFNAPRAHSVLDWAVMLAAILAPSLASVVLWNARAHRVS